LQANAEKSAGGNIEFGMRALFNGVEVPGSYVASDVATNNQTVRLIREFMVNATSGQNLTIQIAGSATSVSVLPGPSVGSPTTIPSATIILRRVT